MNNTPAAGKPLRSRQRLRIANFKVVENLTEKRYNKLKERR
nr:MAG TPA: Whi5-like protein [Microviridae sp.]